MIDPPYHLLLTHWKLPPGLLGENVGHACEGRANHDQQLCPGMGFHTLAPLLRDLPHHNGERINVLFAPLNSPTHNCNTDYAFSRPHLQISSLRPGLPECAKLLKCPTTTCTDTALFCGLDHQSTLPREKQFRRLFGAERLVDAGLRFTAAALAGCFSPFFLLAGAMGALVGSLLPGVGAAPSLKASEYASECAAS